MAGNVKPSYPRLRRDHPLATGLAAAWEMFEGSGLAVNDIVSGLYNATWSNANIKWAGAKTGSGIWTNNAVAKATFPALTTTTTFTLETLVKLNSDPHGFGTLLAESTSNHLLAAEVASWRYYNYAISNSGLTLGLWYHLVFSVNAGAYTMYTNAKADGTGSGVSSGNLIWLFGDSVTGDTADATVDYLRVWVGRALTQADVESLYSDPFQLTRPRRTILVSAVAPTTIKFRKTLSMYGSGVGKRQAQAS